MDFFITEKYLKDNTTISNNCDVKDVLINVRSSSDMYVRSILGTFFYNDLLSKYNNKTLNDNEIILVSYIQPSVAWKSAAESVITLSYQLKNKGIQTQSGDYSNSAEYKEIMFLYHHYSDKADFYLNKLGEYLKVSGDIYPNYTSKSNIDSVIRNGKDGLQSGIMFI